MTSSKYPLNVLLVLPEGLESNNGYHATWLAERFSRLGVDCLLAVPDEQANNAPCGQLKSYGYGTLLEAGPVFGNGRGPDVIHAWTPREGVRRFCVELAGRYPESRLIVHLEDNEQHLTEIATGKPWETLASMGDTEIDSLVPLNCYHPVHGRAWLARADGLTMVIDTLERFNERGVPSMLLPPTVDESLFYPRPVNIDLRRRLGIPDYHVVLVYNGNVHAANESEVCMLYRAVDRLNQHDCPTTLIITGHWPDNPDAEAWPSAHVTRLGWVGRKQLPEILAAADFFVQPGCPDPFNDLRFPSKLPEYFAMGRPVILPRTNLGRKLKHGRDAYVLDRADAPTIAEAICRLKADPALCRRLAAGATAFHRRNRNAPGLAEAVVNFYIGRSPAQPPGKIAPQNLEENKRFELT